MEIYPDEETEMVIGNVTLPGVYHVSESGGGYTSEYIRQEVRARSTAFGSGAPQQPGGDRQQNPPPTQGLPAPPSNVVADGQRFTSGQSQSGSDWMYQNCAFLATSPHRGSHGEGGYAINPSASGVGYFRNCYFEGNAGNQALWVRPGHSGTLVFENCTFKRWGGDALYADEPGKPGAGGGTVIVQSSAFVNNNISHVRLPVGSSVRNCRVWNTGDVPPNEMGQTNSRGLHTFYDQRGGTVTVTNTHVDVGSHNTGGAGSAVSNDASGCTWSLTNCQIRGAVRGSVEQSGVGDSPVHEYPAGAPRNASEAVG